MVYKTNFEISMKKIRRNEVTSRYPK